MSAEKSMGTILELTTGSTATIRDLSTIGNRGINSEVIDVTSLDSPDGFREFVASLKEAMEIPFEGFIKSEDNFEDLLTLSDTQTNEDWLITSPKGSTMAVTAFLMNFMEMESTIDNVRKFSGTLKVSGKPVYTPAAVSV